MASQAVILLLAAAAVAALTQSAAAPLKYPCAIARSRPSPHRFAVAALSNWSIHSKGSSSVFPLKSSTFTKDSSRAPAGCILLIALVRLA